MIYTVTFNPSLDYVVWINQFQLGTIHMAKEETIYAGGKGINVSTVLKQLDIDNVALGFVAGFSGREIIDQLNRIGVVSDFISLNQGMSRINIKLKSDGPVETDVNGLGPIIEKEHVELFFDKLKFIQDGDFLVLSGSVPKCLKGMSHIYSDLCKLVRDRRVRIVVDTEGDFLRNTLSDRPFLIKPNHHELGALFHRELKTREDIIDCAKLLQQEGAQNVLVSMAGDGALLVDEYGNITQQAAPKGEVVNSVGAGDSMVAGFLAGILSCKKSNGEDYNPEDYKYALKFGIATGSASAFSSGFPEKAMIEKMKKHLGL